MRWISEKAEFDELLRKAESCVSIDSGREPTQLTRFTFDDANIIPSPFQKLLTQLMRLSSDDHVNCVVPQPDPINYFWHHFQKYPAIEIGNDDSPEDYFRTMNEDPGNSPADAIGINWLESVVIPPSNSWFVHVLRDSGDRGGRLWVPESWIKSISVEYPFLRDEGIFHE